MDLIADRLCTTSHRNLSASIAAALLVGGLTGLSAQAASPARPAVDLVVQVRLISEADWDADAANTRTSAPAASRSVSISNAAPATASIPVQAIRVQNGTQAAMSWSQTLPIQWMQAASYRGSSADSSSRGGVVNALVWLRAGQSLRVQPSWPGGRHPVRVEVQLDAESLGDRQGSAIPATQHQVSSSTLSVPLGRWTTFAATGTAAPAQSSSTWSSQPQAGRQLMQLRVDTD